MKLTILLLLINFIHISATVHSQNERFTFKTDKIKIRELLDKIELESNYRFLYRTDNLSTNYIALDVKDLSFEELLALALDKTDITYKVLDDNLVVIAPKEFAATLKRKIQGTVTDVETGEPLPGATIIIDGSNDGVITDLNGNYSIDVPEGEVTLIFSFVGYIPQKIIVSDRTVIDVQLESNVNKLEEVIVVGYGTQKKISSTAAVSTLKADEIAEVPVANLTNNFAGRVSGVIADQGSGEPGNDGSRLRIRGGSTTGNSGPLIVVDGIIRGFSRLDPNSVETLTVLKDAAAVAPYGLAGANGVILVTTKKGKTGAPKLSYSGYVGFQNPTRVAPMVNSYQYALLMNEAGMNSNLLNAPFSNEEIEQYRKTVAGETDADPDKYPNSKGLRDVLQKNAMITSHNIQLTGGTENVKYFASLGYTAQDGQFSTTNMKRYNAVVNLDVEATKTTTIGFSINGWIEKQNYAGKADDEGYASANGGIMYQAFRTPPTSAIYYSNGLWGNYIGKSLVGYIEHSGYNKNENTDIMTTFSVEQQLPFLEGLSIKGVVSYDPYNTYSKKWQTPILSYSADFSTTPYTFLEGYTEYSQPQLKVSTSQNKSFTYQGYLNYHNTFGRHDITFLAVVEAHNEKYWNLNGLKRNYPINIDELDRGGNADGEVENGGWSSEQKQIGYVYRIGYNYDEKYMLEVAGRYDGHYYFAPGKRFGFFPSYSLGWNIAKEGFIKDNITWIELLKLRTSYGESGNLAGEAFQYLTGYGIYSGAAYFNGSKTAGVYETKQGNPEITWERATKFDVGLEGSLWQGKLRFEADYFYEKRYDMLTTPDVTVPEEYGVELTQVNGGIMSNHGFEVSLGTSFSLFEEVKFSFDGNFTFAENKLLEVFETDVTYNNPNRRRTGRANGTQFGLEALGYFTPDDFLPNGNLKPGIASLTDNVQPGDLKYADLSGPDGVPDGIIDDNDETVIGRPNGSPQIIYGLNTNISWRGFDLSCLLQGAARVSLPVGGSLVFPFDQQGSASELMYNDHWTPTNTDALYPKVYSQPEYRNTKYSSWWVRDASYLKLRNVELGYTLPMEASKFAGIETLRVYVAGQNLWTWTPNMKEVLDPEAASSNGQYYFQQKVISFGLNISF